ncbi:MAG: hypothetical protein ABI697_06795 [Devosia sp.]
MITRRTLLAGLPAVAAASVVPVAIGAVRQPPAPAFDLQRWLDTAEPQDVAEYHAFQLAKAMNRVNPGLWFAKVETQGGWALVQRRADGDRPRGTIVQEFG